MTDANGKSDDQARSETVLVTSSRSGEFRQYLSDGRHMIVADEPTELGGRDSGPSPQELLLMSLGACTSMTLMTYSKRQQWPLQHIHVRLRFEHGQEADRQAPAERDRIDREIELIGPLAAEQRARLLEIAERCPIHQTLSRGVQIRSTAAAGIPGLEDDEVVDLAGEDSFPASDPPSYAGPQHV